MECLELHRRRRVSRCAWRARPRSASCTSGADSSSLSRTPWHERLRELGQLEHRQMPPHTHAGGTPPAEATARPTPPGPLFAACSLRHSLDL